MKTTAYPSPNFGERAGAVPPSMIILHYTGMRTAQAALKRMVDKNAGVSAHYCVDEDGSIYSLVDEKKRAWHAGRAYWKGRTDINSHSIGIEIVNPGHEFGYRPFPEGQVESVIDLCNTIKDRHDIEAVLAHSDVSPDRRQDPGELFPWKTLAGEGIGAWPVPADVTTRAFEVKALLVDIGYAPDTQEKILIEAFQRHYVPEVYEKGMQGGVCDMTASRLLGLHKLCQS